MFLIEYNASFTIPGRAQNKEITLFSDLRTGSSPKPWFLDHAGVLTFLNRFVCQPVLLFHTKEIALTQMLRDLATKKTVEAFGTLTFDYYVERLTGWFLRTERDHYQKKVGFNDFTTQNHGRGTFSIFAKSAHPLDNVFQKCASSP